MTDAKEAKREQYEKARSEFNRLKVEEKAVFLVEATVSTVARGIEEVGQSFADELDALFREAKQEAEHEPKAKSTASKSTKAKKKPRAPKTPPTTPPETDAV